MIEELSFPFERKIKMRKLLEKVIYYDPRVLYRVMEHGGGTMGDICTD